MKKNLLFLLIFLIFSGCGYKVVTQTQKQNFQIVEIETTGDSRVNFYLKNKLNSSSEDVNLLKINVEIFSEKKKTVKEKNINNEITKYQISIASAVRVKELVSDNEISFNVVKTGDYSVASQYSQTLANEKKLIEVLTDDVTENILNAIVLKLDDL